ncbi:MAG: hypothetical protein KJN79_00565 [Gammaproteobacteria bacterium]|nr:hypothetical protein [Gammaproteobacteria bacterium]
MTVFDGRIDPVYDIQGHVNVDDNRTLADEIAQRGAQDGTQQTGNGTTDNVTAPVSNVQTATVGAAGFTASMVGKFVTVAGMSNGANNGTFLCTAQGTTTIAYVNASGVIEANISATFDVYSPYSAGDDVDFQASDRKRIKGTANATDAIPTYQRPTAVGTNVDANLTNIAGKTTDAMVLNETRKYENASVASGNLVITLTDSGNMQHADAVDETGIPIQDGAASADLESCYAEIINPSTAQGMEVDGRARGTIDCDNTGTAVTPADTETFVLDDGTNPAVTFEFDTNASVTETATLRAVDISAAADEDDVRDAIITAVGAAPALNITATSGGAGLVDLLNLTGGTAGNVAITETVTSALFAVTGMTGGLATSGQRIYGFTQAGSSTEPNSVEVKFYSVAHGSPISTANPYTWEASLPTTVDVYFAYSQRGDNLSKNAFRRTLVNGIVGDAAITQGLTNVVNAVGINPGDDDLSGVLTNLGNYYVWSGLDADPSVVEALNELNEQIGDRDYTGAILSDGQTVTASLQALANAIGTAGATRTIERLAAAVPKNTAHTLPGAKTYTLDGTDNGLYMWVSWRKQLRDPGPNTVQSNDYEETSTTQITPYERIKAGDAINYFIIM